MEPVALPSIASRRRDWSATCFLARIPTSTLDACFRVGRFFRFAARETLIHQGVGDQSVFLLVAGCVKVTAKLDTGGACALLAIRVGGDVVGEIAAVDGQARSATVQVCGRQPTIACVLDRQDFIGILKQQQDALLALTESIGTKLRSSNRRRVDYLSCPPAVRMARVLVELAENHGQPHGEHSVMIRVNLNQFELGTLIGVREATAQRALRALRRADLVVTSHRQPIVQDLARLRVMAQLPG